MGRTERLAQPQKFGKYELVACLSRGKMADVFKAKSHGLEGFERVLAIKILQPALVANKDLIATLIEETQRVVSLAHANVAQVYNLGQEDEAGQFYIASEYIAGFDLGRTLELQQRLEQPVPLPIALFIVSEVAKGLDYAHRRKDYNFNNLNLVHRHLSPTNILLGFDGDVKITDFGLFKAYEHLPPLDSEDELRRILYAAPEVVRGEEATQQSDLYALGLLLYQLVAGQHPYASRDPHTVRSRAMAADIEPASQLVDLPRQVSSLLDSLLVPDPAGRARSAGAVYEEIVAYLFGNNLRADQRGLAMTMQELRRAEVRLAPEDVTKEVGVQEISLAEIGTLAAGSEATSDLEEVSASTNAELPSHKLQNMLVGEDGKPNLPAALEEHYNTVRSGKGKAVLVSGPLGAGRNHLPDRLVDALGWRGNTRAFLAQTTPDDRYVPFGVIASILLDAIECSGDPLAAVQQLEDQGTDDFTLDAFRSALGLVSGTEQGKTVKRQLLAELAFDVLSHASSQGPLVVVVDRVERLDELSLEVLRDLVGRIDRLSLMLVLCTANVDAMWARLDLGSPDNLKAVRVLGEEPPRPEDAVNMTVQAANLLALIGLSGQPMTQSDLGKVTGMAHDQLMDGLRELTDAGLIRVPEAGTVVSGVDDLAHWAGRAFTRGEVEHHASALARLYTQRAVVSPYPARFGPMLTRLHAWASDRRKMLTAARKYVEWLEADGWIHTALDFYEHAANLLATRDLGSPQARVGFLLSRAELALELSLVDVCRTTLQPVGALCEMTRHERGALRAQLLLGQMAMQQDDTVEARTHFGRAIRTARETQDSENLAFALLSMARWHDRVGDPLQARQTLDAALNLYSRWGTLRMDLPTRALMLNRAVRLLSNSGIAGRARMLLDDLQVLATHCRIPQVRCRSEWATASVASATGDFETALELLSDAERRASDHGLVALRIELMREIASAALRAGQYERVVEVTDDLTTLAVRHQDAYSAQRAQDLGAAARCLLGRELASSLEHLVASLNRARERSLPRDVYRCHRNLEMALTAAGREIDAEQHSTYANQIAQRMRYPAHAA